ncbi:TPA: hypothetical protein ACOECQ_003999 [Stenotrophomonas maltophilia]|uniref:hypothetical protein n=2 Tax=Stenotrophomonas maltophilia TaxID=40324 RepID=UPI002905639F|nr:hypothetical protein [Stenotrophomonas maltophilia]
MLFYVQLADDLTPAESIAPQRICIVRYLYRWRCCLPARSTAMSATKLPGLNTQHDPANTDDEDDHAPDPNSFIATLHRIGAGAGVDGRPWPERNLSIGRSIELADADCALVGLRTVAEMALAGERARQNGASREGLGERSMEGLQMAVFALTVMATERVQGRR